jgi:hypothetical protein
MQLASSVLCPVFPAFQSLRKNQKRCVGASTSYNVPLLEQVHPSLSNKEKINKTNKKRKYKQEEKQ